MVYQLEFRNGARARTPFRILLVRLAFCRREAAKCDLMDQLESAEARANRQMLKAVYDRRTLSRETQPAEFFHCGRHRPWRNLGTGISLQEE